MTKREPVPFGHNGGPSMYQAKVVDSGWVRVERDVRNHHLVGFGKSVAPADPARGFAYSRAEAWLDLIMECRYSHSEVINKGRRMTIEPGQLLGAISWLAHRWNWTPKQVRTYLDNLEADEMIRRSPQSSARPYTNDVDPVSESSKSGSEQGNQQGNRNGNYKGNHATVISVCNFAIYQMAIDAAMESRGQPKGQPNWQTNGNQGATEGQPKGNTLTREQEINNIISIPREGAHVREDEPAEWNPIEDTARLVRVLTDAAGPCLDNPVNCSGLLGCAAPIAWIKSGCDLSLDIIPTLEGFGRSAPGRRIRVWDYFTNAVLRARDRRMAMGDRDANRDTVQRGEVCDGIEILEDGAIRLTNGVEQEWLRKFDGNADLLGSVLLKVPPRLRPPSISGVSIKSQILEVLGTAHENHVQRRQNTLAAVDRRETTRRPQQSGEVASSPPVETRAQRLERLAADIENGRRQ